MGPNAITGKHNGKTYVLVRAVVLLTFLYSVTGREVRASPQNHVERQPASEPVVIQGRITGIQGTLVTVKLPDGFPARAGGHPQFVTSGPILRVDVSRARILLPDGRQIDKQPLSVGDHVIMVLTGPDVAPAETRSVSPTYSASIVERVLQGDKITTH